MKPILLEILRCPHCSGKYRVENDQLVCISCQVAVLNQDGIPRFSVVPSDMTPSEKRTRGQGSDTPWREANTRFLRDEVEDLSPDAVVLDVGAGRGDFSNLFNDQRYLAVEVFPYPEVDLVCDLFIINPIAPASLDIILLMNVLEHIPDAKAFLSSLSVLLRPGGRIIVSVPFLVKIHQAPHDFARYTHYLLKDMGNDAGLHVERLEGFYAPAFLVGESERYIRFWSLPGFNKVRRLILRLILAGLRGLGYLLSCLLGRGHTADPTRENNPAPVGYHIIYQKVVPLP